MSDAPEVTIIVPTYREAEALPHLVAAVEAVRATVGKDYELLVVDDDSPDGTAVIAEELARRHHWLRIHTRRSARGLAPSVLDGLGLARAPIVVVMDADLSHPPQRIPDLVAAVEGGADMAIGSRYVAGGSMEEQWGAFRRWNSRAATWLVRPLTAVCDPLSGFFAFRRNRLEHAPCLNPVGYKIGLEILVKSGCREVVELPIHFAERKQGESKLSLAEQCRYVRHIARLYRFKLTRGPSGLAALFILLGTVLRVATAATVGLGIDEAYQVACARQFHWSFFDHPPVSFWMAGAGMWITGSDAPLAVRFPFILLFVLTSVLLYVFTRRLFGSRAAAWATVLFNLSPLYALAAGSWVIPDGPMVCGLLGAGCALTGLIRSGPSSSPGLRPQWFLAAGWLGMALLSKYLAILFPLGVLFYLVSTGQYRVLARPAPWLAAGVAAALCVPVLIWNAQHDWASFAFQGARAVLHDDLRFHRLLTMVGGQALFLMPWIWWPLLAEVVKAVRRGRAERAAWFCACLGLLPVVVMTVIPVWGESGHPHWSAGGYVFLFPLVGWAVAEQIDGAPRRWIRNWLRFSIGAYPVIILVLASHAATGWAAAVFPRSMIADDPTLDTVSWKPVETHFASLDLGPDAVLGAVGWSEGGQVGYALGRGRPVLIFSEDPRHFQYAADAAACLGRDVLFVGKTSSRLEVLPRRLGAHFETFDPLRRIEIPRPVGPALQLNVIVGRRLLSPFPPER